MNTTRAFRRLASAAILAAIAARGTAAGVELDRIDAARPNPTGVELRSGPGAIEITAIRDDILRIRVTPDGTWPEDTSWSVLPGPRSGRAAVTPESDAASVGFRTRALRVRVERAPLRMSVLDLDGNELVADAPGRPVEFHDGSFRVAKVMPSDEHYFGLGDKTGPLDRRNEAFTLWNYDAYGFQESTDPIYKSIPFFVAMRGGRACGLLLDNTWRSHFDFGKALRGAYEFGAEGGPAVYYILAGPAPKHVLESYAFLTGSTPLPPRWSLGFQQSRYSYYPEARVREIVDRFRADRIPADVIYLDIHYQEKNRPFTVDRTRFPHFEGMLADLKRQRFHVVAITDLHIAALPGAGYAPYDSGAAGDEFVHRPDGSPFVGEVWPGPSVFPDFTMEKARAWWGGLYRAFYDEGVAGFWNDMNEPSVFDGPEKTMPLDTVHRIDEPGHVVRNAAHREIHNIYGMENSRATYEGLLRLEPDRRPFVLTRASFAGGQRYAATWTGDNSSTWNHLRMSVPMLLNLGLSGFSLCGDDLGGYAGVPSADLMTEWLEIGMFNPIARAHTQFGAPDKEPWAQGPEAEAIRRRYIEERYRLLPYLYTTVEEASRTGVPIMRPLFLEFPLASAEGRPIDLDAGSEFMFGPDLLVAPPPFPGSPEAYDLVLPPGPWFDYWTGRKLEGAPVKSRKPGTGDGEQTPVRLQPNVATLPVYVRGGAVIARQPLVQSTMEVPAGPLELRIYPGADGEGALYWDDGESMACTRGEFIRVSYSVKSLPREAYRVTIGARRGAFHPWWSAILLVCHGCPSAASKLELDGRPLPADYDADARALRALIPDDGLGHLILVTPSTPPATKGIGP